MNAPARVGLALALLVVAGMARADDKKEIDKAKLVGVWKVTKAEGAPEGATVEFTKDGKLLVKFEQDGEKKSLDGTYTVEGDKLRSVIKLGDMEMKDTDTIKSLTDDKLILIGKDGKEAEMEKIKKK